MATLNPAGVIRSIEDTPHHSRQIHDIVGRVTGGGTYTVTIETKLKSILAVEVVNESDSALVGFTEGDSSTYVGTKTIAFDVANTKTYHYRITGRLALVSTVDTIGASTTIVYEPVTGA